MSDTVYIVLIITLAVIVILFMFRRQLSSFFLRASKEGLETRLETRETAKTDAGGSGNRASVNISGTRQVGRKNKIQVGRPDVNISDVDQVGSGQEIDVQPGQPPKKSQRK